MIATSHKKRLRTFTAGIGAAALGLLLAGCPSNQGGGNTTNAGGTTRPPIHVAANLPLTGYLASFGASFRDGANMGEADLEKSDAAGPKVEFDWQDNAGEGKNAVSILQKQFLNAPDIYLSGPTQISFAVKDQVAAKGTPHFLGMFYPYINQKTKNEFRCLVSYKLTGTAFLPYSATRKPKRVAIPYIQTEGTERLYKEIIVPGLKKQGATDFLLEPFGFDKKDFKDVAAKVKAFNPDLVILDGFQNDMVGLVRACRPLGLIKDGNTLANYDMMETVGILSPAELEGIRVVAPRFVTRPEDSAIKDFRMRFKAQYNKDPNYYHAFSYDMVQVIRDAAKRLTLPATSDQWIDALRKTDIKGVTGPLQFDSSGDLITPVELGVYRKGKLLPVKP